MTKALSMPVPFVLPAELTIYNVGSLRAEWLLALSANADKDTCVVDGSAVDQVDAAGLQLLLSLQRSLSEQQRAMQLTSASRSLRGACADLGLTQALLSATETEALA